MASLENDWKDDEKYMREFKDAIDDLSQKEEEFLESRLKCGQSLERICELALLRREDVDDPDVYGIDKITSLLQTFSIVNREMTNAMGNLFKVFQNSIKVHVDDICKDLTRKNVYKYHLQTYICTIVEFVSQNCNFSEFYNFTKPGFEKAYKAYNEKFNEIGTQKKRDFPQRYGSIKRLSRVLGDQEIIEHLDNEKKQLQLNYIQYFLKVNSIRSKKGYGMVEKLQSNQEALQKFFQSGLDTSRQFE